MFCTCALACDYIQHWDKVYARLYILRLRQGLLLLVVLLSLLPPLFPSSTAWRQLQLMECGVDTILLLMLLLLLQRLLLLLCHTAL